MSDTSIIVSVGSVIGTVIALLAFWSKFSDRITVAGNKADNALQEAAEARNDFQNLREAFDEMSRSTHEQIERMGRQDGDSLNAIRQKVTEVELFMRDNFVRNADFAAAMTKIEASQLRMDTKLDRISEQTRPKH